MRCCLYTSRWQLQQQRGCFFFKQRALASRTTASQITWIMLVPNTASSTLLLTCATHRASLCGRVEFIAVDILLSTNEPQRLPEP